MKKRFKEDVYRQAKPAREEPPPSLLKEERKEKANPQPSALRNQLEREIEEGFEELKYTVVKARGSITWQVIGLSVLVFIVIMIFITA